MAVPLFTFLLIGTLLLFVVVPLVRLFLLKRKQLLLNGAAVPWVETSRFQLMKTVLSDPAQLVAILERLILLADRERKLFLCPTGLTGNILLVNDVEVARKVLESRPEYFSRTKLIGLSARHYHGKPSLFSAEGDDFKYQRRITAPAFAPSMVRQIFDLIRDSLARVEDSIVAKGTISSERSGEFSLDVILKYAFGTSVDEQGSAIRKWAGDSLEIVQRRMVTPSFLWATPLWRLLSHERYLRSTVIPFCESLVRKLLSKPQSEKPPFLQKIEELEPDLQLTNTELVLIAGHETTASSAAWVLYHLASDPRIKARIEEEVLRVSPNGWRALKEQDLQKLVLCNRLVSEVLRVNSPAPFIGFDCIKDFECKDSFGRPVFIPAGQRGMVMSRTIDRSIAPDVSLDGPEPPQSFVFGVQPRICPGRYLAISELLLWTAMASTMPLQQYNGPVPREISRFASLPEPFSVELEKQ